MKSLHSILSRIAPFIFFPFLIINEFISFKYSVPQPTGNSESSWFLISGGYYHSLEPITGKANYNELMKFRKQGAFDAFSRERYKEVQKVAAVMEQLNKN